MFLEAGIQVVGTDINYEKLVAQLKNLNNDNVSKKDWKNVVKQTMDKFSQLDVLVNNATKGGELDVDSSFNSY